MNYAGYTLRVAALLIDLFFFLVLFTIDRQASRSSPSDFGLIWKLGSGLLYLWMNVYMVRHFGGSLGKLLLGMRIVRVDGSVAGYREALLRIAPAAALMGLAVYANLGGFWLSSVHWMYQAWEATDVGVWLINRSKNRRALHDYIAGTVVIKTPPPVDV